MKFSPEKVLEIIKEIDSESLSIVHRDQLSVTVNKELILKVLNKIKYDDYINCDMLLDVTAIDWQRAEKRFEVVYILYSHKNKEHLRIKAPVEESRAEIESATAIYESADWYERETYDMYGIKFINHPGLRRFYMPEDFKDPATGEPLYPLRKDFPLMGIPDSLPLPPYPEKYGEIKS